MTEPSLPLTCPKITKVVTVTADLSLFDDSLGLQYYQNFGYSLSKEEVSLLTSLKHPVLVGCYRPEKETDEIVFDSCEFGSFSDLDVCKLDLSCHDLWSIRNQILQALKYLASHELYHKGLNVSNVVICSLHPFRVKFSLFSNGQILIRPVDTHIPIQEFWKQKMNEQEEVCFDDLIRSIIKSVFPYSTIDKNIVFTNPNTLERNDLESLKALICSIESETLFKPLQCTGDFSSVNNNLYHIGRYSNNQKPAQLYLQSSLLFHIFTQGILKYRKPLIEFNIDKETFNSRSREFSHFATIIISISFKFRHLFLRAFEESCSCRAHLLLVEDLFYSSESILMSRCTKLSHLSKHSVLKSNWFHKFPITEIISSTLNFDTRIIDFDKISRLELVCFDQDLAIVARFPNLCSFSLRGSKVVHNFTVLASCRHLCSISISSCSHLDLNQFINKQQLNSFLLNKVNVIDFTPLFLFKQLTKLFLEHCNFSDLSILSSLRKLRELSLNGNNVTDITTLTSFKLLTALSLSRTKVFDLWPLNVLSKLSTLDLRGTLLPYEQQKLLTNSFEIKTLINSFKDGVDLDCSNRYNTKVDLSICSHCNRLRSINLSTLQVDNISKISGFTNLVALDLSNVELGHMIRITDISFLSSCVKLKSLSLVGSKVTDLSPLSLLVELESLSLRNTTVFDLSPLKDVTKLSILDLRETLLLKEHQRLLTNSQVILALINSFALGVLGLDFSDSCSTLDLSFYSHCVSLKSIHLTYRRVKNLFVLSKFTRLEILDLSNVRIAENNKPITDISFLSSCATLKSLSLDGSEVTDLSPLLSHSNSLRILSLNNTKFVNLRQISLLKQLEYLSLNDNKISDVCSLASLNILLE
ncbi:hypothetical protein RCL1_007894 [Eukaryota sp. TZLM3-RCL]